MEALKLIAPWQVVKIGDTEADIKEGLNAGVWSVGVAVGSSQMGLSYDEFVGLSDRDQKGFIRKTEQAFLNYGANFTIATMEELPELLKNINTLLAEGKRPYALSN
jgi:phosphonoacetaldehyde hydrolase